MSNSADMSNLQPDEQRLLKMYGRLPSRKDLLSKKLSDRKYFDSGDYALRQAGKQTDDQLVEEIAQDHLQPNTSPPLNSSTLSSSPPLLPQWNLNGGQNPNCNNPPGTVPIVSHRRSSVCPEASSLHN